MVSNNLGYNSQTKFAKNETLKLDRLSMLFVSEDGAKNTEIGLQAHLAYLDFLVLAHKQGYVYCEERCKSQFEQKNKVPIEVKRAALKFMNARKKVVYRRIIRNIVRLNFEGLSESVIYDSLEAYQEILDIGRPLITSSQS